MKIISQLFSEYIKSTQKLRKDRSDLGNGQFNTEYALRLSGTDWDIRDILLNAVGTSGIQSSGIMIFYADTTDYKSIVGIIKEGYEVASYYEYFTAIIQSVSDVRLRKKIESTLQQAQLVIVLSTTNCPDTALNAIKANSNNILIMIE